METKTQRFETDTLIEGLDVYGIDFSSRFHFGDDIYNCSNARGEGVGPRYGISPIPGHCHTQSIAPDLYGGLRHSEGSGTYSYENRKKCFGIVPITVGIATDINTRRTHFVFVNTSLRGGIPIFDYSLNVEPDGGFPRFKSDIAEGFYDETLTVSNSVRTQFRQLRPTPTELRTITADRNWCRTQVFNHQGKNLKKGYWVGPVDPAYPDAALRPGLPAFGALDTAAGRGFGQPPSFNFGTWAKGTRSLQMWSIGTAPAGVAGYDYLAYKWVYDITISASSYLPCLNSASTTSLSTSWPNASARLTRDDATTSGTGNTSFTVLHDPELTCGSQYQIIMSAPGKAIAAIFQEHERDDNTHQFFRWIDLTSIHPYVRQRNTQQQGAFGTSYKENSRQVQTCWAMWPTTTYNGASPTLAAIEAATNRNGNYNVALGASGTGLMRGNRTYEFTFAIYDYSLDYESNVGAPAKIRTTNDDGVCLYLLLWPTVSGAAPNPGVNEFLQKAYFLSNNSPFPAFNTDMLRRMNYLEYRVYYREEGTFEWLPAGNISFTEVYFHPDKTHFAVCESPIAALPGGQPGGFNDYSNLPADQWNDVAVFNARTFWVSSRQMCFSTRDNPLAYPARNSVSCPRGEFRGCIVHLFKGQAEQTGRIVVFGSEESYYGEFTGNPILAPVRVSEDTVGQYPLDGSDFDMRLRSTITAFSSRAAVVADGILYYWGPQGIFADDGLDLPLRISAELEPDLFGWFDLSTVNEIHATYNNVTKEVIWFFKPSTSRGGTDSTHGLFFNSKHGKWLYYKFGANSAAGAIKIDWAQELVIDNTAAPRRIDGSRMVVGTRNTASDTISRPFFFDHNNNTGDMSKDFEFVVAAISLVAGTEYEFLLANGYSGGYAALVPGNTFSTPDMGDYSEQTNVVEGLWVITSVPGAGKIRATKPGSGAQFVAGLAQDKYFPIYTSPYNGIAWLLESNQWAPGGIRNFYSWYFIHLLFLVRLLETATAQTIQMQYRTNVSNGFSARALTPANNSNGHYQVLSQTVPNDLAHFGQSIQIKLLGTHLGGLLLLQYVAVEGERLPLTETQIFEG